MGRRGKLPLESPNWMRLTKAVALVAQQTGDEDDASHDLAGEAVATLNDIGRALREGRLPAKWRRGEEQQLLSRADLVNARLFRLHGEVVWGDVPQAAVAYVWKPALKKYFGILDATSENKPKAAKTPVKTDRMYKPEWGEQFLEASLIIRQNPKFNRHRAKLALEDRLRDRKLKVPAPSTLQHLVDQVFAFEKKHRRR